MKHYLKLLGCLLLGMQISTAKSDNLVGSDLLNYFGSTCPSQGDWTKLVANDAEALIGILNNIKNDPDCVTASGAISQLGGLAQKIDQLQETSGVKIEIEKLKTKEIELVDQLTATNDPTVLSEINEAIRDVQIEKAVLMTEKDARSQFAGDDIKSVYSQIVLSTNSLYKSISGNQKCLDKNPRIISTVTSLVSSIGGAVSIVNPALGIGLAATSEFFGNTVEAIRIGKINRNIRKIADGTLANSGFKCALESLSNRWCELSDAKKLLKFKFNLTHQTNEESGFLSAIRIYDRKVPAFLDWLTKVRAGAPASTAADASRHSAVFERLKIVQTAQSLGDGILTENEKRYEASVTDQDKYSIIKQVISRLATVCPSDYSSSTVSSPLNDIYSTNYAPYYLLGLPSIPRTNGTNISFCDFDPFTDWPGGVRYIPKYDTIGENYTKWINKATTLVNQEFTIVLQPDALGVLTSAYDRTGSRWKISPKNALDEIVDFLNANRPNRFATSAFEKIYNDTIGKLNRISDVLDETLISNVSSIDTKTSIEEIFSLASLQYGTVVLNSRLEMAVRLSVDEFLKNNKSKYGEVAAQLFAADSYLDTLRKVTGKDSDELVMLDIENGQTGAMSNMRKFVEVFAKNINGILQYNDKQISHNTDSEIKAVYSRDQNKICILLSSMPSLTKNIDLTLCRGRKLPAFIAGGPESQTISSNYMNKDFNLRSCEYRNYIRKSKIYREWKIKI